MLLAGERHEHYELLGELASGGMATVYLGRERSSGGATRLVAVKSMLPELASDEGFLAMFLDEATLTAKIKHPNVVSTLDVVSSDGRLLIVMEYVEGMPLARLLEIAWRKKIVVPAAISLSILCDVLAGLHAAHELVDEDGRALNVVHRDVSPQNILLGVDGAARILDFGIAKAATQQHVTARGEIKGKLAYMPAEQQLGEVVDRRSDVYAAGVVLWELLVGRRLFLSSDEEEIVRQVFEGLVQPPSLVADEEVSPEVDRVVLKALARRREDRWWSAAEMARALERASAISSSARIADRSEVRTFLLDVGREELQERSRHVRELLGPRRSQLDAEEMLVLELLTGQKRRTREVAAIMGGLSSPAPAQTQRISAVPPLPQSLSKPTPISIPPPSFAPASIPPSVPPPSFVDSSGVYGGHRTRASTYPGSDAERNERRERRRRARRRRQILLFASIGAMILVLAIVALFAGMRVSAP